MLKSYKFNRLLFFLKKLKLILFLLLFLSCNHSHYGSCDTNVVVNSPGVHNFQLSSDVSAIIGVPENYQAFIFSNVDLGPNNAFYLDNSILPVFYKNLFGIAFNGSSQIVINGGKKEQNMAVFIIPTNNCNQHAFYGMSHGDFRINLTTLPTKNDIQACAFQPSFITDIYQNITFGVKTESDQEGHIFYGFDDKSSQPNDIMTTNSQNMDHFNNKINNIIQELNYYKEFKKLYRKKFKQMDFAKDQKKYINFKQKPLYEMDKFSSSKLSKINFLIKDENEELFFQQNYQKYKHLLKINSTHNFKNLNWLMKQEASKHHHSNSFTSPGFLYSNTTTGIQSFTTVNTEFYVIYKIKRVEKSSEVILERKFLDNQNQTSIDNSMLYDHYDFLLYYDKSSTNFIYDTDWVYTDEKEIIPKSYFWKVMKWFLALIIIIVSIIIVFIVVSVVNYTKRNRLCCFKKLNNNQEMNEDDYDLNMAYPNVNRRRSNNSNELELETVCYPPDLDDLVTYNKSTKKRRSSMIDNYNNVHDSDSYEYITESLSSQDDLENNNGHDTNDGRSSNHKKKRVKRMKINCSSARISTSPYDIDLQNETDIGDLSAENLTNETTSQDNLGENGENIPNPYGLPSLVHNSNETNNNDDTSDVNPTC